MIRTLLTLVGALALGTSAVAAQSLVRQVLVNGKPCPLENNTITLRSSDNLTIIFATSPHTATYFYQLENKDKELKRDVNPLAMYSSLKRGTYNFQAYTEPRQDAQEAESIRVVVKNSFMDSWWFVPLLVFYLLLLFGGASYFILLSNFRNKEKVYDLRNDWTNKLHNDIGGDLSSVSLRLDGLKRKLATMEPQMQAGVLKTYDILKSIQKKLRFVFDLVDPKKNSLHVMLGDIEDFARENFTLVNIQLDYQNELKPDVAYNVDIGRINKLYLATKEAVNNCMKYSEATLASLHIRFSKEGLHLELKDNGKGFDMNAAHKGNGIKNLQQYAREGFMDLKIWSEPGKGTTVTILVPNL